MSTPISANCFWRFTCLLVDTEQAYDHIALYLQKQFAEIGVDMQIQPVSAKDFGERVNWASSMRF